MNLKVQNIASIITVAMAAIVLLTVIWGFGFAGKSYSEEQLAIVKSAVERAAIQCYSLEGSYPPNAEYLFDNYGVAIDRSMFTVIYVPLGGNLMPQITIVPTSESRR